MRFQPAHALILAAMVVGLQPACGGDTKSTSGGTTGQQDAGPSDAAASDGQGLADTAGGADAAAVDVGVATGGDAGPQGEDAAAVGQDIANDAGAPGPTNTSFETAVALKAGIEVDSDLSSTGAIHYFKFDGKQGEPVLISVAAQEVAFDKQTIDTVLTLYDKNKKKIGENDDPLPRTTNDSTLVTLLPSSGTFYVTVQECWTWVEKNAPGASCAEPKDKVNTAYSVVVRTLDPSLPNIVNDAEKGDTAADATPIGYGKSSAGNYVLTLIYGMFSSEKDVDVYAFTPPADSPKGQTRPVSYFDFYPSGPDGNGSTASAGVVWIASAATPTAAIASVDQVQGGDLGTPLDLGKPYLLYVPHAGGKAGENDFYFINHRVSADNPLEAKESANDKPEGAEPLTASKGSTGGTAYFVAGNLINDAKDIDHFSLEVAAATKITVACSGQRSGSGLRDLSAALLLEDGTATAAIGLESAKSSALIQDFTIPSGAKKLILKLAAGKQAADVSSDYYRCGVHLQP